MKDYTYTRKTHDPANIRYKLEHSSMRLIELSIALRNISEEAKELADIVQDYYRNRHAQKRGNHEAAQANVTATPRKRGNGSTNPIGGAFMAGKEAGRKEVAEPDSLSEIKHLIVRWLLNAPTDICEDIAPLIPAPVSMVKRVRTQLVEAGKLRPLDSQPQAAG